MLRITAAAPECGRRVLLVDGWLTGADAAVLEEALGDTPRERTSLDLGGLRSVDESGIELLRRLQGEGVTLRGGSLFLRALLDQAGIAMQGIKRDDAVGQEGDSGALDESSEEGTT